MESYPGELLVGVSPLVFCVDATLASNQDAAAAAAIGAGAASPSSATRSQFDRFLDVMAASLLDEPEGGDRLFFNNINSSNHSASHTFSPNGGRRRQVDDGMLGLFRGDEGGELDSDQEDDMILGGDTNGMAMNYSFGGGGEGNTTGSEHPMDPKRTRSFSNISFPRLGGPGGGNNRTNNSSKEGINGVDTSFANALREGQGFFQRARIVSISSRHGFPPSKDPTGDDNRIKDFFLGKTLRMGRILAATKRRPIDGILPSGWLEKHAAALPSVIIVVAQVSSHQQQHEQNSLLEETMKNLQTSLAGKRGCTIRVVGLVQDGISTSMAQEWKQTMTETLEGQPPMSLLDVASLQQDAAPSMTLRALHKEVHDASFRYYVTQARRTKHKLYELGPARGTPLLLPLCIRYCFKVAMFYEFQWNPEKSLKYMVEAYRHVETYYRYLLQQREIANSASDGGDAPKIRLSNHGSSSSASTDDESGGVEMSLQSSEDNDVNNLLLNPPAVPEDMVHQCRVLADWLNFKILQSGLTSNTEGGVFAASAQLQKNIQAFCNPLHSFVCSPEYGYMDWSFVAHQRMVASQLLERNPPRAIGELGNGNDEVLLRCSPWKAYEATAEALLRLGAEVKKAASDLSQAVETVVDDDMRSRYVGGLDKNGYRPKLQDELKVNHRELALDCLRRAISFHERDIEKREKEGGDILSWSRSGARSYYLAGGTLLGLERYAEAASFLEKAVKLAKGWKGLELTIRRMLVLCYKKHIPPDIAAEPALLLDSYFNAEISSQDLGLTIKDFPSTTETGTIKWHCECFDEEDGSLPFSYALTFPSRTHATAGDSIEACLRIRSNIDYAVHVTSVTLLTLAGKISLPSSDLLSAKNADEGHGGGIIIQAKTTIWLSTSIKLPKSLNEIANDESGNGGQKKEVPGKGSFSKSARPRTGGVTSAGKSLLCVRLQGKELVAHSISIYFQAVLVSPLKILLVTLNRVLARASGV
jgi:tetratricopeptide (TPR) repeat protein